MFSLEDKKTNLLDVKVNNFGECGFCSAKENKEILKIPWSIFSQWLYISQCMGSKEWGAVFWIKDDTITRFKIPKQQVGSSECEFSEDLGGDGIMHSHHDMGAFHSSQDDHHARNLYVYSIVLSNQKGYAATKRVKLPCNGFGYVKVELHLTGLPDIELDKISVKEIIYSPGTTEDPQRQLDFKDIKLPCDRCTTQDCQNCAHFYMGQYPCETCVTVKCKDCRRTAGMDISQALPFCDFCEDYDYCPNCDKLARYLENYPQDRKHLEHLVTNNQ
jgi:hypothetical protein